MFNNLKVCLILIILSFSICSYAALSTENPPFILKEWDSYSPALQLGGKVNVKPNDLTDLIGTTKGTIIRFNNNIMEVKFTGKDGRTEKGFFNIKDAKEEIAYYKPEVAKEWYESRYDDLDKDSLVYFTTERKIRCGSKEFQDKHPGHKEICTENKLKLGKEDLLAYYEPQFKWKKEKYLKLKPLKNFVSKHKTDRQKKDNYTLVDDFLKDKKYKCQDLQKYKGQETIFIERCYYTYSPINKYEFFIVVFVDSNHGLYCSSHSKMTVYRIEVGHYKRAREPEGHGNTVSFVAQCDSSPFGNAFYSRDSISSFGGDRCSNHSIVRARGGYPNNTDFVSYAYSKCGRDKAYNKIDFKSTCTSYVITNPMDTRNDVCSSK